MGNRDFCTNRLFVVAPMNPFPTTNAPAIFPMSLGTKSSNTRQDGPSE
jgi:hypothetical protein